MSSSGGDGGEPRKPSEKVALFRSLRPTLAAQRAQTDAFYAAGFQGLVKGYSERIASYAQAVAETSEALDLCLDLTQPIPKEISATPISAISDQVTATKFGSGRWQHIEHKLGQLDKKIEALIIEIAALQKAYANIGRPQKIAIQEQLKRHKEKGELPPELAAAIDKLNAVLRNAADLISEAAAMQVAIEMLQQGKTKEEIRPFAEAAADAATLASGKAIIDFYTGQTKQQRGAIAEEPGMRFSEIGLAAAAKVVARKPPDPNS